jgi:hypothetical protein
LFARPPLLVCLVALLTLTAAVTAAKDKPAPSQAAEPPDEETVSPQVDMDTLAQAPPAAQPISIQTPRLAEKPAAGMGRLRIDVGGTRKWCTFQDDRVMKPVNVSAGGPAARGTVFTFGYMFSVAAVNRAHPSETILLFESPTIRTAVMRPAGKIGRAAPPKSSQAPVIGETPERVKVKEHKPDPATLVPYWQEEYRCTSLPEAMDFDVAPGTYDLYMAFDILLQSGSWAHRTIAYQTDVSIGEGNVTRLQAAANMRAGGRRELELSAPSQTAESSAP